MEEKKVVVITGASGGIGLAVAEKFASHQFRLVLADIQEEGLRHAEQMLRRDYNAECLISPGDLTDMNYVQGLINAGIKRYGRIDVLINNAAWRTVETMRTISVDDWEKTLKVCLTAPAFLAKYAAREMEERKIAGTIINISSVMSQRTGGNGPAYVACKAALESLTTELAVLYGPKGIRVVGVRPGNIDSQMSADYINEKGENISKILTEHMNDHTPLQRPGRPEEIANVCYWLSTEEASFVTGTSILVDGGFQHNFNAYTMKKLLYSKEF